MTRSGADTGESAARWAQVKAIFHRALERPSAEHGAFLAEACAGDDDLRREVESLLLSDLAARSFCETPAAALLAQGAETPRARPRLPIGARLDAYEITGFLGAGGMGEVYRARDGRLHRDVAIKTLGGESAGGAAAQARLVREARHASRLSHAHICRIYEVGEAAGTPFMVMEYVEGRSLRDILADGPLSVRRALALAGQIAAALEHAHQRGIVHRDLKSSNVVVTPDHHAVVLDFGLSKRLPERDDVTSEFSQETRGAMAGTLSHMAPELLSGRAADAQSDVWAFGVLLFEMLAGTLPFSGRTAFETSSAILNEPPRGLPKSAGIALRLVLQKCLAKDPALRYRSAAEVRDALDAASRGRGVVKPLLQQHRGHLLMGAAAVALAVALWAIAPASVRWGAGDGTPHMTLALLPLENGTGDAADDYYVDGMTDALIAQLGTLGSLRVISRASVMRYRGSPRPAPEIARELGARVVVQGTVRPASDRIGLELRLLEAGTGTVLWSRRYERSSREVLVLQADAVTGIAEGAAVVLGADTRESLTVVRAVDPVAYEAYLKGRYYWNQRTEGSLQLAVQQFSRAIELDPTYAPAHAAIADCYNQLATVLVGSASPRDYRPRAAAAAIQALQIDPRSAEAHATLGFVKHYDLEWEEAERQFRRAIELNPSYALARVWYANMLIARRQFDAAVREVYVARDLDPFSPVVNTNVGWMLQYAGRFDEAIAEHMRTLQMAPEFPQSRMRLASALVGAGRDAEALHHVGVLVEQGNSTPWTLRMLVELHARMGNRDKASAVFRELLELSSVRYVPANLIAEAHLALGDIEAAFPYIEQTFGERLNVVSYFAVERAYDPVRGDPRFQALLARAGLP